jgi:hypothetical protein
MAKKPHKTGSIPTGAIGLVLSIIFCIQVAVSPVRLTSVLLGAALGFAGLVISVVGIAKGAGRVAGVCGIAVFLVGCLMLFSIILDILAHHPPPD